ncbi:MAG: hypothetical protein HY901_09560 [Deltaproteobacteria bacterium]|nr:hypothetical protein [Deltaproteobacteria bacterium]
MTTLQQKPEADAIRIGLLAGLFSKQDAINWADLVIADTDKPCSEVLDLSMGDSLDGSAIASLLSAVPGQADLAFTKQLLLSRVRARLGKGKDQLASAVGALNQLTSLLSFTDAEKQEIAKLGTSGDEAFAQAEKLLAAYAVAPEQTRLSL